MFCTRLYLQLDLSSCHRMMLLPADNCEYSILNCLGSNRVKGTSAIYIGTPGQKFLLNYGCIVVLTYKSSEGPFYSQVLLILDGIIN